MLQADLQQHKSDVAAGEQERRRLQAAVTDHRRRLEEEREKKERVSVQLELLSAKLLKLESEWTPSLKPYEWLNGMNAFAIMALYLMMARNHFVAFQ